MKDFFSNSGLIGQNKIKKRLNFYLGAYQTTRYFPPLLKLGPPGIGKSVFARIIGKNLKNSDGKPKKFVEVQGKSLTDLDQFITEIVEPFISNETTLFIDEIGTCSRDVMDWLLFALQPNSNRISVATHKGQEFVFDLNRVTILSATTNPEKMTAALLSRFKKLEFEAYHEKELVQILELNCSNVNFKDDVELEIIKIGRESPREIVLLAEDIKQYCQSYKVKNFTPKDWSYLKEQLSIQPLGLTESEISVLRLLYKRGPQTLTGIASTLGRDTQTIRRNIETYLLKCGLIRIEGKRVISAYGRQIYEQCI